MRLTRILKIGAIGDDVKYLQERLLRLGFYSGLITNSFGPKLEESIKQLQSNKGLNVDGVVGLVIWEIIKSDTTAPKPIEVFSSVQIQIQAQEVKEEQIETVESIEVEQEPPVEETIIEEKKPVKKPRKKKAD